MPPPAMGRQRQRQSVKRCSVTLGFMVGKGRCHGFLPLSFGNTPVVGLVLVRIAGRRCVQFFRGIAFKTVFGKGFGLAIALLVDHFHGSLLSLVLKSEIKSQEVYMT